MNKMYYQAVSELLRNLIDFDNFIGGVKEAVKKPVN